MRRVMVAAAICAAGVMGWAVPAGAASDQAPHGGEHSHPHHVQTGNGCKDLQGPDFEPAGRGRHRGANSSGTEHGPWHGSCEG